MARHPRLILPGVALHVIQRANNRNPCFAHDSDYLTYRAHLRHLSRQYECELHATSAAPVCATSTAMGRPVPLLHRRIRYVLACYRYIELNPVRAGMVTHASAYPWSSHAVNTGTRADAMVVPHCEYTALAVERANLHPSYRQLFAQAFDDALLKGIRDATNGGYPLVSESFKSRMTALPGCRTERGRPGPRAAAE